jgi:hypothetical protein
MKKGKICIFIILAVLVGGGLGFGVTKVLDKHSSSNNEPNNSVVNVPSTSDNTITTSDSDNDSGKDTTNISNKEKSKVIVKASRNGNEITANITVKSSSGKVPSGDVSIAHDGITAKGSLTNGAITLTFISRAENEFVAVYHGCDFLKSSFASFSV